MSVSHRALLGLYLLVSITIGVLGMLFFIASLVGHLYLENWGKACVDACFMWASFWAFSSSRKELRELLKGWSK